MKKKILYIMPFMIMMGCLWGCDEYEMQKYSDKPGVNFMAGEKGTGGDALLGRSASRNFGNLNSEWNIQYDTVILKIKLEGIISDQPLHIRLKADTVDKYAPGKVIFADDYVIEPGGYMTFLPVVMVRPEIRDSVFMVRVRVDYEKSDVVAGTKERQFFDLKIEDELTLEMTKLTENTWNSMLKYQIGAYTNTKLRFMVYALGTMDFSMMSWGGLWPAQIQQLNTALAEYNDAHPGKPVLDEDGEPLTFEP